MGVNLRDLVVHHEISWQELEGKSIAIDALNNLYQFLAIIRQPDGTPLMDKGGRITSHLSGLFYRTVRIFENKVKPCYVFDGKPPELKIWELERRREIKHGAREKWDEAKDSGDWEAAKRYASMTSKFDEEMLEDAKRLIEAMGVPIVQAPSEGETQCAYMARKGAVYATGSQDYDSLLAGSPVLIKNLTMTEKFLLERIELGESLKSNGLTREQLVDIAILMGTDFNEGVRGIGPKKALKIVKGEGIDSHREELDCDLEAVRGLFLNPGVTEKFDLKWNAPDEDGIRELLVDRHDFSADRVDKASKRLKEAFNKTVSQANLSKWF